MNEKSLAARRKETARPYPSNIFVTGLPKVSKVTVILTNLTEARPDDLDIILVSPAGTIVKLMSDAGTTVQRREQCHAHLRRCGGEFAAGRSGDHSRDLQAETATLHLVVTVNPTAAHAANSGHIVPQ